MHITGLQHSNYYDVSVQAICNPNDTSSYSYTSFQTGPLYIPRLYVRADASYSDSADGSSWERAFNNLYDATEYAGSQYDYYGYSTDIWVASGNYYGTLYVNPAIHYYGGFAGNEAATFNLGNRDIDNNPTVIDGNGYNYAIRQYSSFDNSQFSSFDGFILTSFLQLSETSVLT